MADSSKDQYTAHLEELLYQAIVELQYVQESESHELCASCKGRELINLGMATLGVSDLSAETFSEAARKEDAATDGGGA